MTSVRYCSLHQFARFLATGEAPIAENAFIRAGLARPIDENVRNRLMLSLVEGDLPLHGRLVHVVREEEIDLGFSDNIKPSAAYYKRALGDKLWDSEFVVRTLDDDFVVPPDLIASENFDSHLERLVLPESPVGFEQAARGNTLDLPTWYEIQDLYLRVEDILELDVSAPAQGQGAGRPAKGGAGVGTIMMAYIAEGIGWDEKTRATKVHEAFQEWWSEEAVAKSTRDNWLKPIRDFREKFHSKPLSKLITAITIIALEKEHFDESDIAEIVRSRLNDAPGSMPPDSTLVPMIRYVLSQIEALRGPPKN